MHLEVKHLRLIDAIAKEGSVTKAANRLFLTQSALSHQLHDVEEKLGVPLFDRVNKRMVLTPAGKRVLEAAGLVIHELTRAEEEIQQIATNREGTLRISTECYTCYHWLPSILTAFNREYPFVDVQIVVEATRAPHQALLNGQIDLALVIDPVRNAKIAYQPLFRDELVVVMEPNDPLSSRPFIRPEDFVDRHLIIYSRPEENRAYQQVIAPAGVTPARISSVQLTEAIVEMVKAGLGLGILSRWSVAPHVNARTVSAVRLTKRGMYRHWSTARIKRKVDPPYLTAFIRMLADNPVLVMSPTRWIGKSAPKLRSIESIETPDSFVSRAG